MDLIWLLNLLCLQVVLEHLLESVTAEFTYLRLDEFLNLRELIAHNDSSALAFPTRQAILVYLWTIAFEANDFLLDCFLLIFLVGDEELAADLTVVDRDVHLTSLSMCHGLDTITAHVFHLLVYLNSMASGGHTGVNDLVFGLDASGVAASVWPLDEIGDISTSLDLSIYHIVTATGNLMELLDLALRVDGIDGHASSEISHDWQVILSAKIRMAHFVKVREHDVFISV